MKNIKIQTEEDVLRLLQESEENGQMDEIREMIASSNHTPEELLAKKTPSKSKLLANKADMPQSKATTMMKRIQKQRYADLSVQDLGVLNRLIKDYECSVNLYSIAFAGEDHPIFNRLIELANKYPNRRFIANAIRDKIDEKKEEIQMSIDTQKSNLALIQECEVIQNDYPYQWEEKIIEDLGERALNLFKGATAEKVQKNIDKLENNKREVDKWKRLASKIKEKNTKSNVELKNNLYYEILNELERVYELSQNVGHVVDYKAEIDTGGFSKNDIYSSLARELERQVGLCEDADTHNFYYSNNEGRLVPYQLNRQFLKYINENTTFYKYDKNGNRQFKKGDIINAKALFNEIPDYCNEVQYRNQSLIGFNNCFYNIDTNTTIALNPKIPIMPLRNCKTELYLDEEIEDNPMKEIFQKCFTEEDRKTLLAYIGCCLYDHGYTQRQESLFIMGKGGTGKTTLTKAMCSIFYDVGNQLVSKLKSSNEFGLSVFADNDIIIIDEIQSAHKDFANYLKNISGGGNLPVEKKHHDTIVIPATNVPRMILIGNNFSKPLYQESGNAGINRRILIVIPTQPIQDLGFKWDELIQDSCKQWLAQEATKEYIAQGLHESSKPIGTDKDGASYISEVQKEERLKMCVYPERFFLERHFEYLQDENGNPIMSETISYDNLFDFVANEIDSHMVESTCKKDASNMFIGEVREALKIPEGHYTKNYNGVLTFTSVAPKTEEAIEFLAKRNGDE